MTLFDCKKSRRRHLAIWLTSIVSVAALDARAGDRMDFTFEHYSPLSRNMQMAKRLLSPLAAARVERLAAESPDALREQAIDLANERFAVYVPKPSVDGRYGLLVFIPPWNEAKIPAQWTSALDRHALIFVTASNSGNDANVLDRREPLTLLAAQNIMDRYRIDPSRVFVSGFSGGSRVALRLALAYPDLFRGALLQAGSDPIGTAQIPLPPRDLFSEFQEKSRIVYLTGREDREHLDQDSRSAKSLRDWCVAGIETETVPWIGHDIATPGAFDKALTAMMNPPSIADVERMEACRKNIDAQIDSNVRKIETALADGRTRAARDDLIALDAQYSGLAAPRSLEILRKIEPDHP